MCYGFSVKPRRQHKKFTRLPDAGCAHSLFEDVVLINSMTDNDLIWTTFLRAAWGPTPEHLRELKEFEEDALNGRRPVGVYLKVVEARAIGEQAYEIAQELKKVFQDRGETAARNWIGERTRSLDRRIGKNLKHELGKMTKRQQIYHRRRDEPQDKSSVRTSVVEGQHRNSLRQQRSSTDWSIYIDETGSNFDEAARGLSSADKAVGRIVALAVPAGTNLVPTEDFHAADSTSAEVDRILQRVLDTTVGILGFSVQNHTSRHRYWVGHVVHLVRWTLLQLPVPPGNDRCKVRIYIEKRGSFNEQTSLDIVRLTLESELGARDPQRYRHLELDLRFMNKSNPMNGYVDAVAFTWGSPSSASKDRLEKSLLLGHCLIDANETSLHHLYLSLNQHGSLAPGDWYALCTAASSDPEGGFLSRALDRLGHELKQHPGQWQRYLAEVQLRLHSKQYSLPELGNAIAWLEQHADSTQTLPGVLQLQLSSSSLALANHQGRINRENFISCLKWIKQLRDEVPQMACEALLRMSSTLTNNFEFDALDQEIDDWLEEPVAVAGLLNYGKLQSTRGQLLAFRGQAGLALPYFEKSLSNFARLSDPAQVKRESQQTRSYQLIAMTDAALMQQMESDTNASTSQILAEITQHFGNKQPECISSHIARSAQTDRFDHHLWLRTMVCFPRVLAGAREAYLKNSIHWQSGHDHPWPLIYAYRASLLRDAGKTGPAQKQMGNAIDACLSLDHGPALAWMAEVLRTLALALGLDLRNEHPSREQREHLQKRLPFAPHAKLSTFAHAVSGHPLPHADILAHLTACLPFNFH